MVLRALGSLLHHPTNKKAEKKETEKGQDGRGNHVDDGSSTENLEDISDCRAHLSLLPELRKKPPTSPRRTTAAKATQKLIWFPAWFVFTMM